MSKSCTTTRNDTFFNRCTGRVESIFDAKFAILEFGFSSSTDFNYSYATRELSNAFLQLFFVVVRVAEIQFFTNLSNTFVNIGLISNIRDDGGFVLRNSDLASSTKHFEGCGTKFQTSIFRDNLTIGENGDILQHRFTAIAKTRGFDCCNIQRTSELVHN